MDNRRPPWDKARSASMYPTFGYSFCILLLVSLTQVSHGTQEKAETQTQNISPIFIMHLRIASQRLKIGLVGIPEKVDDLCTTLSGGQKRRLWVATALLGETPLVFLDEPTSGMDPSSRRQLWELLLRMRTSGARGGLRLTPDSRAPAGMKGRGCLFSFPLSL